MAAAVAGASAYLVSGDRALLAALPGVGLRGLAPAEVIRLHGSEDWPWGAVP